MKNEQLIDDQDQRPKRKLTSIQLLITLAIILAVTFGLAIAHSYLLFF